MTGPFRLLIANVYSLRGGPTVVGRIESGRVRIGDALVVTGPRGRISVRVKAIQKFSKTVSEVEESDEPVGISLSGIEVDQIQNRDQLFS